MPALGGLGYRKVSEGPARQKRHPVEKAGCHSAESRAGSPPSVQPDPVPDVPPHAEPAQGIFRRGLIDTPIATRDVRDVPLDMTPAEKAMYDALGDYIDQTYNNASPENARRSALS